MSMRENNGTSVSQTVVPLLVSLSHAAELMGLSYWTVRDLVVRGELAHKRCGKKILVRRADVVAWVEDGMTTRFET